MNKMYRVAAILRGGRKPKFVRKAIILATSKEEAIEKFLSHVCYIEGCVIDAHEVDDVFTY